MLGMLVGYLEALFSVRKTMLFFDTWSSLVNVYLMLFGKRYLVLLSTSSVWASSTSLVPCYKGLVGAVQLKLFGAGNASWVSGGTI